MPEWASDLSDAEFARFRQQLDAALTPARYSVGDGFVTVEGRPSRYGLTKLAAQWQRFGPTEQPGLVAAHFRSLFEAQDAEPASIDDLLGRLRPRLWASAAVRAAGVPLISRPLADDLETVLCVDLPAMVVNLKPEQADATGRPIDELWEIAARQIDDGLSVQQEIQAHGIRATFGDSVFLTSRLLDLERLLGPMPADGAFVAVPHRHVLLTRSVEGGDAAGALSPLIQATRGMFHEGPGSLVPHVYWWRRAEPLTRIPSSVDADEVRVMPPTALLDVLGGL